MTKLILKILLRFHVIFFLRFQAVDSLQILIFNMSLHRPNPLNVLWASGFLR